jgi:hypothetical protein
MTAIATTQAPSDSLWSARAATASRLLLGALLVFSVANALLAFAPQPPLPAAAQAFLGGLFSAPYFFALLKGTELLVAIALLTNRFVPLALTVLAPITINIVLFHLALAPAGAAIAVVLLALHLYTAWTRRASFAGVLATK